VTRRRAVRGFAVAALALALASCSHSSGRAAAPGSSTPAARRAVLVTIGSNATFGDGLQTPLRDAWPQKLYHDAFSRSTTFVNAGNRHALVSDARSEQLPLALEVHATVVAMWIGDTDLAAHHSAASFEAGLDAMVARLRASGARVLLGNLSRARAGAGDYDDAIARVAAAHGAIVVDLATALLATPHLGPSSSVNITTSARIAEAFAAALARS
jgi:GDSL-like Lipase/Acylhydrolase family